MYHRAIKILLITSLFFIIPQIAQAGFLDDVAYCTDLGNCNLEDIAVAFSSLIRLLLGAMGGVALIYFVWGGTSWLISGGSAERVAHGRTMMINTVFALILAFGSYLIITFFVNDILNVKTDFRIEKGKFTSCQLAPRGRSCGDTKQCSGPFLDTRTHLNDKCLDICQIQRLDADIMAYCMDVKPEGWIENTGSNLCSGTQKCVFKP